MAAPAANYSADEDLSFQGLIVRVVKGDGPAWAEFVERFSRFIFKLLWRYANRDQDQCADLYLYVIEGLHQTSESGESFFRLRRYLDSLDVYQGKGRLTTWLGKVTQNLVSDYFREQEGRKTLPRNIQRLDSTCQQVFKLLYWDNLPEREAYATISSAHGGFSREKFDRMVDSINRQLKTCNRWALYSEVLRRTPALPLFVNPEDGQEKNQMVQVADPSLESAPLDSAVSRQDRDHALAMGKKLRELLTDLPKESRQLLLYRFKHGLTAGQISKLLRKNQEKQIYSDIEKLKSQLQESLNQAGFNWQYAEDGLEAIEGLLDEFETSNKPKKSMAGKQM